MCLYWITPQAIFAPALPEGCVVKSSGPRMDDNGVSDHFIDIKPVGNHRAPGIPFVAEQRRQIARVFRMFTFVRIIMSARVGKRILRVSGTAFAFVNVQCKYARVARAGRKGQSLHLG